MNYLLRKFHLYLFYFLVLFCFLLTYPYLRYLALQPDNNYAKLAAVRKWISRNALRIAGIRIQVSYEQAIDWSLPYIICPNHSSMLDISILDAVAKQPCSFMGKVELLQNPVTKIFFQTIDIPVDRANKRSSFKAFKQAESFLNAGRSLVIFPEGKIDDEYPPRLHPFKKGAFRLAKENNKLLLPVVILNAWEILWDDGKRFGSRPGIIQVKVLSPIDPASLQEQAAEDMEQMVYSRLKYYWDNHNKS